MMRWSRAEAGGQVPPPPPGGSGPPKKNIQNSNPNITLSSILTLTQMFHTQRRKQYQVQIFITLFCLFPNKTKFCESYLTSILLFPCHMFSSTGNCFSRRAFLSAICSSNEVFPRTHNKKKKKVKKIQVLAYQTKTLAFPNLFSLLF